MPDFTGMTRADCPKACTEKQCCISTVGLCKHPLKASDQGCGPITIRNREEARKFLGLHKEALPL
jgi:hypothetical protein